MVYVGIKGLSRAERELVLMKIRAPPGPTRMEVLQLVEIFRARVADVSERSITLCVTGDAGKARPALPPKAALPTASPPCLLSSACMPEGSIQRVCDSDTMFQAHVCLAVHVCQEPQAAACRECATVMQCCKLRWPSMLPVSLPAPLCAVVHAARKRVHCWRPALPHGAACAACSHGNAPRRRRPPWSAR